MQYHIRCDDKDIARYVLCPGDPLRAKKIADHFTDDRLVSDSRGYMVYSGYYEGVFMTSIGTGMGGPTVSIALEELANMGADTFIRVGSCSTFQPGQDAGDIVIGNGTFRYGSTADGYLPPEFPAVPHFDVLRALVDASGELGLPCTVGVGIAVDAFYGLATRKPEFRQMLVDAGVVSIEMESDTLFLMGSYHGWRTGGIYVADGGPGKGKDAAAVQRFEQGETDVIRVALHALRAIARRDGAQEQHHAVSRQM